MARATASIQAESRGAEAELAQARAELERARNVYLRQRDTLNDIDRQMIQRIPALRKMAEDSYLGGNSGILELLDAHRSVHGIRQMHLEQREAVKQAEASVLAAAGLEPLTSAGE
jgi:cobalt-zinc-cadmium efflux system outer membrane protein